MPGGERAEYGEVFQQRNDANDDHNDAHDLPGAAIDRQHVDEIKHQNDDQEGDEHADDDVHA
jgi:hypothetical protein